jgi:hypothetical protein
MQKFVTLSVLLLAVATSFGQITLTDVYFPAAGDTLYYGVGDESASVDQLLPGEARQWDFGVQEAISIDTQVIIAADDLIFTQADVSVNIDSNTVGFYSITDTAYQLIGIRGDLGLETGQLFSAPISPGRSERRAPLEYQDRFSAVTTNELTLGINEIPQELLGDLGGVLGNGVDSVRISATTDRTDVVDAYGSLTINGQTYNVLREKRSETVEPKIEVLSSTIIGYVDITSAILPRIPDLADFIGNQEETITYYYWTDTEKEAVAIVTTDRDNNQTGLRFIRADSTNSFREPLLTQAQVKVYPNPAVSQANFVVEGIAPGQYTLRVINVLGRQISQQIITAVGNVARAEIDVTRLPRGTYLYSLTNERGLILTTRRLLVGH